ncbi:MAG: peptidylprolyl isomerase [Candidatus Omnitrophota bacterium]|nr:peptidylprolyl isomerase [Candidatus Omnitrophota bacterium]
MIKRAKFAYFILHALLILFFFISGCGKAPEKEVVLASIGDAKITVSDFNERIANLPERYREVVSKKKNEYLLDLIDDTLLYQEAVRKNIHRDKDVQQMIEEAKKKIMIARLLKDEVDSLIEITEDDMQQFYGENRKRYMTPEIMRVSHILLLSREDANDVLDELSKGGKFEDLARARSVDPTAQNAGDIGYFPKGQLMPEFEDACAKLDKGETSGVVKTKLGYHIIKLTNRRKPEQRPIEQVAEDIKSRLRVIKRRKAFTELLGRLRKDTVIEINEEVLSARAKPEGEQRKEGTGEEKK